MLIEKIFNSVVYGPFPSPCFKFWATMFFPGSETRALEQHIVLRWTFLSLSSSGTYPETRDCQNRRLFAVCCHICTYQTLRTVSFPEDNNETKF